MGRPKKATTNNPVDRKKSDSRKRNGMGGVYQLDENKYVARIQIGKQPDGKPKIKALYATSQEEAQKKLDDFIKEMHQSDFLVVQKTTIQEYMENWFTNVKANELKPSSYDRKEQTLKYQVYPHIGYLQLANITSDDVQRMVNKLKTKYSYSTIKKAYEAVNECFKWAVIKRDLRYNPALGVKLPTNIQPEEGDIRFFSEIEIESISSESTRLYSNGTSVYRLGQAIILLLNTGMRIGEASALKWTDIDIQHKTITIRKNMKLIKNRTEIGNKYILQEQDRPKSKAGSRIIPINEDALIAIKELIKVTGKSKYVLSTSTGKPVNPRNMDRMFRNILTQCNLPLCGVHALRHTFASILFKNGVDVKTVSELLGHADVTITYNTYVHLIQEQKIKAVELINI